MKAILAAVLSVVVLVGCASAPEERDPAATTKVPEGGKAGGPNAKAVPGGGMQPVDGAAAPIEAGSALKGK